jgi:hypothetical protein
MPAVSRPRLAAAALLAAAAPTTFATDARAQCDCDHQIQPGTEAVNGTELGVQPGETVCIMAGAYSFIRFREIRGEEGNPVTVVNCGGVVEVKNTDRAYAIDFQGSSHHFRLTGTGDSSTMFGFRVSAPDVEPYPGVGLWFLDKSTDYEVDHVEVYETGFAGVMAKTDPLCDGSADQDVFIQKNVRLHHLWVHDTGGEGFYVGSTQSNGHTITCNEQQEVHQPHFLEGIEIDHVLVEDTGWDGAQVGMARQGCVVRDSVIRRVGLAGEQYQQQGLQIGSWSRCHVRRNVLSDGQAMGVFVLGAYDTTVADNVIMRFAEDAVYANANELPDPVSYRLVHNTLGGFGGNAARVFGDLVTGVAWNNLVLGSEGAIAAGGDVTWSEEGNLFVADAAAAGFVDASADDYHLADDSPARAAGVDHTADGFDVDLDGMLRASPPAVGAYEHADDSPGEAAGGAGGDGPGAGPGPVGAGGGVSGAGASPGSGASSGATDGDGDDGCGCRLARSAPAGHWAVVVLGAALLGAVRLRRAR